MSPEAARFIGAGIAVLALYGIGMSLGNLFSTWISSVARNPEAEDKIKTAGIFGLALVESTALFTVVVAILILLK